MKLTQIFGFANSKDIDDGVVESSLLSPRHFQDALRRERLRSDRSGNGFSLLTLTFPRHDANDAAQPVIVDILENRLRATDVPGWLNNREIGIILPYTGEDGARKLAEDLQAKFEQRKRSLRFRVSVYPSIQSPEEQPSEEAAAAVNGALSASSDIQPLEMMFVQKLPVWKRAIDIFVATMGLVAASPVIILAALAIKLTSPGPVFFLQRRDSAGGRPFQIYKLRTMRQDAEREKAMLRRFSEQDGPAFKMKNDPRVTVVGSFLRRTSIDELPQLWNVVIGDMSLVGPRPLPCDEARRCNLWQRRRLDVTPGLTCIWQVEGRSRVTFAEWMRMDLKYIRTRSLSHDLKLLVLTVPAIVLRRGAC